MKVKLIHALEKIISSYYTLKNKPLKGNINNIALICTSPLGIGDLIMSTPFMNSLQNAYPKASIDLITDRAPCDSFKDINIINIPSEFTSALKACAKIKTKYDLVIVMNRAINQVLYAWKLNYKYIMGYLGGFRVNANFKLQKKPLFDKQGHFSYMSLHNASALNIPVKKELLKPIFSKQTHALAKKKFDSFNTKKKVIAIAPFCNWETRTWHQKGYIDLIKKLHKKYDIILYGGPAKEDKKVCDDMQRALEKKNIKVHSISGGLKLKAAVCFLKHVDLMVASDSGQMHFSLLMGIKTVALFGPIKPKQRLPLTKSKKFKGIWYGDYKPIHSQYNYDAKHEDASLNGLKAIPSEKVYKEAMKLLTQ